MKRLFILLTLVSIHCVSQIHLKTLDNYSLTITPNGITGNYLNTPSTTNLGMGDKTLRSATTGTENAGFGNFALSSITTGSRNIAISHAALARNTTGNGNVCIGYYAGANLISGTNNIFIGHESDTFNQINFGNLNNAVCIGSEISAMNSNTAIIGNWSTSSIGGAVAWSNWSDRRMKENIIYNDNLGLEFIKRLRTVSYNLIKDTNKVRRDGFIAQDVEKVLTELGIPFSGLQKSEDGTYSLSYSDFVMPLVNAVKEQQEQINELKRQNENLVQTLADLKDIRAEIAKLKEQNTLRDTEKK